MPKAAGNYYEVEGPVEHFGVTFEERIMLLAGARGLKPYFGTRRRAGNRFWLSYAVEGESEAIGKFLRDLERELKLLGCVNLPCTEWYARGLPWIRPQERPPKSPPKK